MNLETKLSAPRLSPAEIADILERHLGDAAVDAEYAEACAVLRRMRRHAANVYLRYALRPLDDEPDARVALRKVLATLRTWRHLSGA
jgi:hypothetical protein